MQVAVDTNGLYTTQAGVARYLQGLLRGLRMGDHPDFNFVELAWPVRNLEYRQPARAFKTIYREFIWAYGVAPRLLRMHAPDLLHTTSHIRMVKSGSVPEVHTLYDLAVMRSPERFRRWQRFAGPRVIRNLHRKRKIICISQFTADEALRLTNLKADRFEVVYLGSDFDELSSESLPSQPIPNEFFLFVGSLEPGKNLLLLKEVYQTAAEADHHLPPLVIVGARWEGVAGEGAPPAGWHYLGRQSDEVLVHLYRRALALVFPSKYEGFGLPVLEAMALGCPVICSRAASLPEVGGEAPLYAELTGASYLAAMKTVAESAELRSQHQEKGKVQAQKFSWKRCGVETVEIYRSALR